MNFDKMQVPILSICKYAVYKFVERQIGACVFGAQASACALFVFGGKYEKEH